MELAELIVAASWKSLQGPFVIEAFVGTDKLNLKKLVISCLWLKINITLIDTSEDASRRRSKMLRTPLFRARFPLKNLLFL